MRRKLFLFILLLPLALSAQSSLLDSLGIDTTRQTAVALQYWFDQDFAAAQTTTESVSQLDVSALSFGLHTLHMQIIHDDGSFGIPRSAMFIRTMQSDSSAAAASLQYWFDQDFAAAQTTTSSIRQLDVSALSFGLHTLHMQIHYADGSAGSLRSAMFIKTMDAVSEQSSQVRYWFDKDDSAVQTISTGIQQLDISQLSKGYHTLHMQIVYADGSVGAIRNELFSTKDGEETCLTIGTGTGSNNAVFFNNYYKNAWTQSIYTADEIGYSGDITSIQLHCAAVNSSAYADEDMTIYMAHTSMSVAGSTSDWILEADLVEVYSASPFEHPTDTGWFSLDLQNAFSYNGTDNLAVVIGRHNSSYASGQKYSYSSVTSGTVLYRRNDSDASYGDYPGTNTGTKGSERANIMFCFMEASSNTCQGPILISDTVTICQGETYRWYEQTLSQSGSYQTLLTNGGCDSICTLTLNVMPTYTITKNAVICQGETYTWHGRTLAVSGIYRDTLLTIYGCDSICVLNLTISEAIDMPATDTMVCEADMPILWHGMTLTTAGTYNDTLHSFIGCDSVHYTLNLTVSSAYLTSDSAVICEGETYTWHGRLLTESGQYADSLKTINGCDSIFLLSLQVNPTYTDSEEAVICQGESYRWHGREYRTAGLYVDTLQTVAGCDSICMLNLTVNPTYLIEEITSVREDKLPYMWQGEAINQSGDYRKEYTSIYGCDSVHTLHFMVTALPIYTVVVEADHGHVNGTGTYPEGTQIHLEAVPDEGFEFQMWSDTRTENPKNFTVMQDTTFRAHFFMPEVEQEVTVDSIDTRSVTISWDTVAGATLYELCIYKNGRLIVTFHVDRDNNIINTIFAGPERIIAKRDSTGGSAETLQVDVSGLDPGSDYTYSLDSFGDDRNYVGAQSGSFTTEDEPIDRLDTLFDDRHPEPRKVLRKGRLYIEMPDGTLYDARGVLTE